VPDGEGTDDLGHVRPPLSGRAQTWIRRARGEAKPTS